jgi:hypothetical protein
LVIFIWAPILSKILLFNSTSVILSFIRSIAPILLCHILYPLFDLPLMCNSFLGFFWFILINIPQTLHKINEKTCSYN